MIVNCEVKKCALVFMALVLGSFGCKVRSSGGKGTSSTKDATIIAADRSVFAFHRFGDDLIMRHCPDATPVGSVEAFELKCLETAVVQTTNQAPNVVTNQRIIPLTDLKLKLRQFFSTEETAAAIRNSPDLKSLSNSTLVELDKNRDDVFIDLSSQVAEIKKFIAEFPEDAGDAPASLPPLEAQLKTSSDLKEALAKFDTLLDDVVAKITDREKLTVFRLRVQAENVAVAFLEHLFTSTQSAIIPADIQDQTRSKLECKKSIRAEDQGKGLFQLIPNGLNNKDVDGIPLVGSYTFDSCQAAMNNGRNNLVCLPDGTVYNLRFRNDMRQFSTPFNNCLKSTRFSNPKSTCVMGSDGKSVFTLDVGTNAQNGFQIPNKPDGSPVDIATAFYLCIRGNDPKKPLK